MRLLSRGDAWQAQFGATALENGAPVATRLRDASTGIFLVGDREHDGCDMLWVNKLRLYPFRSSVMLWEWECYSSTRHTTPIVAMFKTLRIHCEQASNHSTQRHDIR